MRNLLSTAVVDWIHWMGQWSWWKDDLFCFPVTGNLWARLPGSAQYFQGAGLGFPVVIWARILCSARPRQIDCTEDSHIYQFNGDDVFEFITNYLGLAATENDCQGLRTRGAMLAHGSITMTFCFIQLIAPINFCSSGSLKNAFVRRISIPIFPILLTFRFEFHSASLCDIHQLIAISLKRNTSAIHLGFNQVNSNETHLGPMKFPNVIQIMPSLIDIGRRNVRIFWSFRHTNGRTFSRLRAGKWARENLG